MIDEKSFDFYDKRYLESQSFEKKLPMEWSQKVSSRVPHNWKIRNFQCLSIFRRGLKRLVESQYWTMELSQLFEVHWSFPITIGEKQTYIKVISRYENLKLYCTYNNKFKIKFDWTAAITDVLNACALFPKNCDRPICY